MEVNTNMTSVTEQNPDSMQRLTAMVQEVGKLEVDMEEGGKWMAEIKRRHDELTHHLIPQALSEAGVSSLTTTGGRKIEVGEQIFVSITKANEDAAFAWLHAHGHGALIKTVEKTSVHPQSLKALMRDLLSEGVDVPVEVFSLHRETVAKIY